MARSLPSRSSVWGSFAVGGAIVFAGMFAGDYLTVIIAAVLFGAVGFVLRRASARGRPLPLPPPPPPLVPPPPSPPAT